MTDRPDVVGDGVSRTVETSHGVDGPDLQNGSPASAPSGEPRFEPVAPMEQRTVVVLIAGFSSVLLAALMLLLPVPYVILKPGPVLNTLGKPNGKPLITVTGHPTYAAGGRLDLTTVSELGGAGRPVGLLTAMQAWISQSDAVLPRDAVIPKGQTVKQADEENRLQMASSQENATAAALATLGIQVPTRLVIAGIDPAAPSVATLEPNDVIKGIAGAPIRDLKGLSDALQKVRPGDKVTVTVLRGHQTMTVDTGTSLGDSGQTILAVYIAPRFTFPFRVKIQIEDIGGPSAGTMFALGIIDLLTPGDLTGGKHIAGTGTMDATGTVGPIGGIQQKLVGARKAGAVFFLAPVDNCNEVRGHVPQGLTVVRISTLDTAETAVKAIAAGRGGDLPGC